MDSQNNQGSVFNVQEYIKLKATGKAVLFNTALADDDQFGCTYKQFNQYGEEQPSRIIEVNRAVLIANKNDLQLQIDQINEVLTEMETL